MVSATATGPPGALWWVSGTAQHAARHHRSHSTSAGSGWRGSQQQVAALALGPTAQAGLCPRPGNLSCVSAGDTAPHRRHHPWAGDPADPAPSATLCRPTSQRPRACLPRHLHVGLALRHRSLWEVVCWGGVARSVRATRLWPALMARRASRGRRGGCCPRARARLARSTRAGDG